MNETCWNDGYTFSISTGVEIVQIKHFLEFMGKNINICSIHCVLILPEKKKVTKTSSDDTVVCMLKPLERRALLPVVYSEMYKD